MTETANSVIVDALTEILVQGAEAPIEASEAQGAIRYLNRMMAALDAKGIQLGYTEVSNMSDPITVPLGAVEGMVNVLAFKLWNQYSDGAPPPMDLAAKARDGMDSMRILGVTIGNTEYPDTLPIGSGNEWDGYRTSHFYPSLQDDILAESTGSIGLETDTADET